MAFNSLEAFGDERADLRIALMAVRLCNLWISHDADAFKVEDFLPVRDEPEQTVAEQDAALRTMG